MEIFDKLNQINYVIDEDLVYSEKIAPYLIIDREDEINSLESYIIPEARSESDKELMREDLEELPNDPSLIYLQELNKEILCVDKRDTKNISLYWGKDNMYDEVVLEDLDSIIGGPDYLEMLAKESIKKV